MKLLLASIFALAAWPAMSQTYPIVAHTQRDITQNPRFPNQAEADVSCAAKSIGGEGAAYYHQTRSGPWTDHDRPPEDRFEASDSCALRLTNLSGVWESGNQQYVATHDPRSAAFSARRLYIPPDQEPRKTWEISLGDLDLQGRLHESEMWLDVLGVFPPSWEDRCPDSFRTRVPAAFVSLTALERGSSIVPQLSYAWPRLRIQSDCSTIFMERNAETWHKVEYTK